jgi:uncharacterized protein (TIGR02246 family)
MKHRIWTAAFVVFAAGAMAQSPYREAAEIEAVSERYRQAWQRGDLDGVMQFWTPDAKSIGPGGAAIGTDAIRASLERSMSMGIHDLRHESREVYGGADTVVEVTRSVVYDQAGKALVTLRYMTLWRKADGRWRIHRDFVIPAGGPGA